MAGSVLVAKEKEKKAEILEKIPVKMQETLGRQRILMELADKPKKAVKYAKQYEELVSSIVDILKSEGVKDEREFFKAMSGILYSNPDSLGIKYKPQTYLYKAIKSGKWDCDTASFLVFDVGRKLGLELSIISVPEHALVGGKEYGFESTLGVYYDLKHLHNIYPVVYGVYTKDSEILSSFIAEIAAKMLVKGKKKGALTFAYKATELNPSDPLAFLVRGVVNLKTGNHWDAVNDLSRAIELNASVQSARLYRAVAYTKVGEKELAIKDVEMEKILKEKSEKGKKLVKYATKMHKYFSIGNYKKTIDIVTKIINLKPPAVVACDAYMSRAYVYYLNGQYDKALADWANAIKIKPTSAAYYYRFRAYTMLGDYEKAKKDYETSKLLAKKEKTKQ